MSSYYYAPPGAGPFYPSSTEQQFVRESGWHNAIQGGNEMNQGTSGNWQSGQWTGTQVGEGLSGMGPSSLASGAQWVGHPSFSGAGQGGNFGNIPQGGFSQGWSGMQSSPSQWSGQGQGGTWTGTRYGEGQPGMGGSSLAQGAHWVGQSSFGGLGGGTFPQSQGQQGQTQLQGQAQSGWSPSRWTGTQYGEGQPGMGGSSLAQGARWGGQPSFQGGMGSQQGIGSQGWTGTQYGEGLPGMGGSSLAQGARWGGQPSFQGGIGSQQGAGNQGWTGTQYGEGQPGMGSSSLAQGAHWVGQSSMGSNFGGQSSGGQQQVYLPPWTRGSQGGQSQ